MTTETQQRLTSLVEKVIGVLCAITRTDSYEEAIAWIRPTFQDKSTSPAPWLHKSAREIVGKLFPDVPPDSVNPEFFYEILGLIDTREKMRLLLPHFPEEAAPMAEQFLNYLLKDYFPSVRSRADEMRSSLPQRRAGPKQPWKMPDQQKCREICSAILKLQGDRVKLGVAQRRLAAREGLNIRMVQRIWADRDKYLFIEPDP